MQIKKKAVKFQPVTLVLEDEDDLKLLLEALRMAAAPGAGCSDAELVNDWLEQLGG